MAVLFSAKLLVKTREVLGAPDHDVAGVKRYFGFWRSCTLMTLRDVACALDGIRPRRPVGVETETWVSFVTEHLQPTAREVELEAKLGSMREFAERFDEVVANKRGTARAERAVQEFKDAGGDDMYLFIIKYVFARRYVSGVRALTPVLRAARQAREAAPSTGMRPYRCSGGVAAPGSGRAGLPTAGCACLGCSSSRARQRLFGHLHQRNR